MKALDSRVQFGEEAQGRRGHQSESNEKEERRLLGLGLPARKEREAVGFSAAADSASATKKWRAGLADHAHAPMKRKRR